MTRNAFLVLAIAIGLAWVASADAQTGRPAPQLTRIAVPQAQFTRAFGINPQGDVVGGYGPDAPNFFEHGFLLHEGNFTAIDDPEAGFRGTEARGVNGRGDIVGAYWTDIPLMRHGFLLHNGSYTAIDEPDAATVNGTLPLAVNDRGDVVGVYFDANFMQHGFLLHRGSFTTLDEPNAVSGTAPLGINDQEIGRASCRERV